ncbi:hypothetical protein QFC21_001696 [Naganishia friedmannii]|uniref:Uncharacterized protein n=1 Tax=Naganishia friedmannii TaxID=89922 RepID=A0ACC2W1L7_9TREE|nr:hypothetical protein QFC21_001696 [Naganishia friedmannii]
MLILVEQSFLSLSRTASDIDQYLEDNCTPEWKRAYIDYRKLKKCIKAIQRRQISGEAPGQITEADIPDSDEHQQDEQRGSTSRRDSHEEGRGDEEIDTMPDGLDSGRKARVIEGRNGVDMRNDDADDDDEDDDCDDDDDSDTGPHAFPDLKKAKQGDDPAKSEPRKSRWLQHRKAELEGKLSSPRLSIPASSPAQSRSGSIAGYGSMGRTPPMHKHRAASPPILVLPDPSNPEADNSNEKIDGLPQTANTRDAETDSTHSIRDSTPLTGKGKKHLHWDTAKTNGNGTTEVAEEEGDVTAASGSGSGSGRDSSSGDEDRILPLQKAVKSPRLLARSPSFLPKSPKIFGNKGAETPGVSRNDSTRRTMSSGKLHSPFFQPSSGLFSLNSSPVAGGMAPRYPETIEELYKICYTDERRFFAVLDGELEKVEAFYHERESDAIRRSHQLQAQLKELAEHRRVFHEAEGERNKNGVRKYLNAPMQIAQEVQKRVPFVTTVNTEGNNNNGHAVPGDLAKQASDTQQETDSEREQMMKEFDPEKYQRYKKKLKVAVVEHYKELEILKNYRILNLTGFKKALKKFEKTARIRCIDLYMDEKVAKRSFADHRVVDALLKVVEDEYTKSFERGDHKKALGRLRGEFATKTHHLSTFWSGIYIGIGVPILILGLVQALEPGMSHKFIQRDGLLVVYATLFLPVIFGMLFELNLTAYVSARINYPFIMELDVRTALDHRQFLEGPRVSPPTLCRTPSEIFGSLDAHTIKDGQQTFSLVAPHRTAGSMVCYWGLLRPRYAYLRESLGYPSIRHYYYVAMVLNVLIRFIWVWYIPASASYLRTRAFFFALAEMLRRWQWNFFRVETEQVGNTDQYRVTREVPLPYHRLRDDEDLDEELEAMSKYGKEKGFSLRRAALRLGDIREQLIRRRKTAKSVEPKAGARTSDVVQGQEERPSTGSGRKSLSTGINGAEEEIV